MAKAVQSPNPHLRKPRITAVEARRLFAYDPDTGVVTRRVNINGGGKAGSVAGALFDGRGHLGVLVDYERLYLHRVIWLIVIGEWPVADVDHRDGDPANNRWANLREATRSQKL